MSYQEDFKQAGAIARDVLQYGTSLIKPGASYVDVLDKLYKKIEAMGAKPAFPPQMACNEVAAHFMPGPNEDVVFNDQLIKLDVGVCVNGAIGDNATTVDLSGQWSDLVNASREAVEIAVDRMEIGMTMGQIGAIIHDVITGYGFAPVKNLSGHGLASYTVHCKPTVPNYDNNDPTTIEPGMTFACEPFATNGKGMIYESEHNAWIFRLIERKPVRDPLARKLMSEFEQFGGLPFSLAEVTVKAPLFKLRVALKQLERAGALQSYGPLIEEEKGFVAQAEHSVLFDDDGRKWITTR